MAYIGHNYIGHNYIGHTYIGHNYIGHNYIGHNYIGHNYIRYFLTGGVAVGDVGVKNPCADWLSDKSWGEVTRLAMFEQWKGLVEAFPAEAGQWKTMYDSNNAITI